MNDTVPRDLKCSQKPREHGCSLSLGVVKKNDACMCSLDAPKDKLELLIGRHPKPIARPYVCPKNYNPPLLKIVEQGSRGKPGNRKNGVIGSAFALPYSALSVLTNPRLISALAAFSGIRPSGAYGVAPYQKEGGARAFTLKRVKNERRRDCPRSVVESQNNLFRPERQRLRKRLAADLRGRRRVNAKNTRGAERVRSAVARHLGAGRRFNDCD